MIEHLTRNLPPDHLCKYAVLRLDKMSPLLREQVVESAEAIKGGARLWSETLQILGTMIRYVELGGAGSPEEAFVIKLKDRHAARALRTYAASHREAGNAQFADEVDELAARAEAMPNKREPD